jgi:hypothetical protein
MGLSEVYTLVKTMGHGLCPCVTKYLTNINVVYMNHRGVCPVFQTSTSVPLTMASANTSVIIQTAHSAAPVTPGTEKSGSSRVKVFVYGCICLCVCVCVCVCVCMCVRI